MGPKPAVKVETFQEALKKQREEARKIFADLVPANVDIGCSIDHWMDYRGAINLIDIEMACLGYRNDELAEFALPDYHMCDIDGYELTDERGDYMRKWYDEESSSTFGYTKEGSNYVKTQWHDDGRTTMHWGGPCAPTTYDKYGEEC
jgi:hypothetical protein